MTADERINALLERAGCPVMVVKSDAPPTPERHMADLIDRLEVALENALNERDFAADTVRHIVALDVAPVVHARWMDNGACSNCKCMSARSETIIKQLDEMSKMFDIAVHRTYLSSNYCPNCGARMDGDTE